MTQIEVKNEYDTNYSADLYTNIKPPVINEGDNLAFNNSKQEWEYSIKGEITLAQELILHKQNLIKECVAFYESLRQFKVIAGKLSLPIFANETTSQNINTWVGAMNSKIASGFFTSKDQAYYEYLGLKIPYIKCVNLKEYSDYIRTEIVKVRDYHVGNVFGIIGEVNKIQTIEELKNYNYKINANKEPVKPFDPIIL